MCRKPERTAGGGYTRYDDVSQPSHLEVRVDAKKDCFFSTNDLPCKHPGNSHDTVSFVFHDFRAFRFVVGRMKDEKLHRIIPIVLTLFVDWQKIDAKCEKFAQEKIAKQMLAHVWSPTRLFHTSQRQSDEWHDGMEMVD